MGTTSFAVDLLMGPCPDPGPFYFEAESEGIVDGFETEKKSALGPQGQPALCCSPEYCAHSMTTRMPTDDQELSSTDPNRNRQNPRGRKDSAYKKSGQGTRRYRLIEQLKVKGFMTQNDQEKLYSTNGDQWQRDTIVFDHAQHWTGQKDRYGQMIFWGDLVTFRLPDGQMSPKQLILGSEGQTILACTETRRFQPIDEQHQEFELRYGQVVQQITNYPITLGDYNALRVAQIVRSKPASEKRCSLWLSCL